MADENGWDSVAEVEETTPQAAAPEENTEPVAEIPNEAIDRDIPETPAEGEPEEDPDAWRNVRFEEDPAEANRILNELAERSEAVRRAIGNYASLKVQKAAREREQELVERAERAERLTLQTQKEYGDRFWGQMQPEQRAAYLARNPAYLDNYNAWVQVSRQMQQQSQQVPIPAWVRNLVNGANDLVDQYALRLPSEYENQLRQALKDPQTFAMYKDNPHQLVLDLQREIDTVLKGANNGGVQVDATPRAPAPAATASARTRNDPRVQSSPANPALGKFAPDTTRRSGSSGGETYTRAQIAEMTPDEYGALRERYKAKTGQELYRRGIIVD